MIRFKKTVMIALLTEGLALSSPAGALSYTFTDLGFGEAKAINNVGQVAGYNGHAIVWNGTKETDLGTLGGSSSNATAINDAGQVAGSSYIPGDTAFHATLWNGTTATDLGTLGGPFSGVNYSYAYAINDAGQVAGNSNGHATVWNGTTATDLGTLGGTVSAAQAINNAGQAAGFSNNPSGNGLPLHATLWNDTTATDLGALGGTTYSSIAYAINNAGQVAGEFNGHATVWNGTTSTTTLGNLGEGWSAARSLNNVGQLVGESWYSTNRYDGAFHATLWNGSAATDLNSFLPANLVSEGWVLAFANGINDKGWIVGSASKNGGGMYAFLLTPNEVPIPAAVWLFGSSFGLLPFVRRKKLNNAAS